MRAVARHPTPVSYTHLDWSHAAGIPAKSAARPGSRCDWIRPESCLLYTSQEEWVKEVKCVGVTAGASAPDILVQNVVARLQQLGGGEAIPLEGREENIVFEVPKELRVDIREVD